MTWHKLTFSVTVSTEDLDAAEHMSEMICDVTEAILNGVPETTVETFDKVSHEITEPDSDGEDASFTTAVSEYGHSLAVNITKQANRMNIRKGDKVLVIIRRIN